MRQLSTYNYVYVTTNLLNGKQYVGDRTCYCEPNEDKYLGSGIYFKNAKKQHKRKNFNKEILEIFNTRQEAFNAQEKYIIQFNTLSPNGYNISPKGGHRVKECWSEESKQKMKKSMIGKNVGKKRTQKTKDIISYNTSGENNGMTGKHHSIQSIKKMKNSFRDRTGSNNSFFQKHHSKESKQKISESHKGKHLSEETIEKIKKTNTGKIRSVEARENYRKANIGRKLSEVSIQKMKNKAKNRKRIKCIYCNKEMTVSMHNRWHGDNCKIKNII